MIEVSGLSKSYRDLRVVENLTFTIEPGQIVGFLGINGAGKTSTLRMMTGALDADAGSVRYGGVDLASHPLQAKQRFGYMPEAAPMYPELRVSEYLRFRAELKGIAPKKCAVAVSKAMQLADITSVGTRIIGQLSKGTRQRVAFADALVADPEALILDEPTAGLDPNQIRQFRETLRSFAGQKTILLSTHILGEVTSVCDRVLLLHQCSIQRDVHLTGAAAEAARSGGQLFEVTVRATQEQLRNIATIQVQQTLSDDVASPYQRYLVQFTGDRDAFMAALADASLVVKEIRERNPGPSELEAMFSQVTQTQPEPTAGRAQA